MSRLAWWLGKARAYKAVFGEKDRSDWQVKVLADLAKFCGAEKPSVRFANGQIDTHASMIAEGRREVWLRIKGQTDITENEIHQYIQQAEGMKSND